jgi:hypothetical protein
MFWSSVDSLPTMMCKSGLAVDCASLCLTIDQAELGKFLKLFSHHSFAENQTASLWVRKSNIRQDFACRTGNTLNPVQRKSLISIGGTGKSLLTTTKNSL